MTGDGGHRSELGLAMVIPPSPQCYWAMWRKPSSEFEARSWFHPQLTKAGAQHNPKGHQARQDEK
eukprot:CAMPEP_0113525422 /NCGR_PEP_ID=MMETSP0015_2-20120614/151_1 /TAXON_ID=2838 /ORGANISM="Odontella" /LENGTH=64 /DNA_ID=CAMNT_0000423583 /DNA_START=123 /DNA_END=317 /DNA_ORIENTATION=+ /assembly_acc=CAM_ASM_000160